MFRNRIRFEDMESCECGNGQNHRHAAAMAWAGTVEQFCHERGYEVRAEIRCGFDPGEFCFWDVPATVAEAADEAGLTAAYAAYCADCSDCGA